MTFKAAIQRIHLWAGLILGVQVLLWMLSGVIMSWFHISLVRGETNSFPAVAPELNTTSYASPGGVIAQADGVTSLELRSFLGRPVYEIVAASGPALFDAMSGDKISPITQEMARQVAKTDYVGDAEIISVKLMRNPPHEYRRDKPVWRADINDRLRTRIYVSHSTGEITARRNDIWRVYDFFWMLHIMDYGERDNFNNPLIKAASAAGLVFAISGMIIVFMRLGRGRYGNDAALVFGNAKRRKSAQDKSAKPGEGTDM